METDLFSSGYRLVPLNFLTSLEHQTHYRGPVILNGTDAEGWLAGGLCGCNKGPALNAEK